MKDILSFWLALPLIFLIIQSYLFLLLSIVMLRKYGMLKLPYAGMETGEMLLSCSVIFGVLLISSADAGPMFQALKTYQSGGTDLFQNVAAKCSQYFTLVFIFMVVFLFLCLMNFKIVLGKKFLNDIESGSVPQAILGSFITIGLSIILVALAKEFVEYISPKYLNFG